MPDTQDEIRELDVLLKEHLPQDYSGKVRDSYGGLLPRPGDPLLRLSVPSDRASIFDFPLGFEIRGKGELLTAFNIGARQVLRREIKGFEDDLVAFGSAIDEYLPRELRGNKALQKRATVVKKLDMIPLELVVRGNNAGSTAKEIRLAAKESRMPIYCGHELDPDMREGAYFNPPISTPTTKAAVGHDEPRDYLVVEEEHPGINEYALKIFRVLQDYARECGIILVDFKIEASRRQQPVPRRIVYTLCDELMTSDSSRFWKLSDYNDMFPEGTLPPSLDKQILREWGKRLGIDKLDPSNPEHLAQVVAIPSPGAVDLHGMQTQIETAFHMLHGMVLKQFQAEVMGVNV